jgi:hypothetical protein
MIGGLHSGGYKEIFLLGYNVVQCVESQVTLDEVYRLYPPKRRLTQRATRRYIPEYRTP